MKRKFKNINSALTFWGYWNGRILMDDGFPIRCAIDRIFEGMSNNFHSQCLLLRLPNIVADDVEEINGHIMRLKRYYSEALVAKYCLPDRDDRGYKIPEVEYCRAMGVTPTVFRKRVQRAKKALAQKIVS